MYYVLCTVPIVHAASWVPPQPPFSEEGNPPSDAFFGDIFDLYKYIRPKNLQVYENAERSRKYEHLWVCGGEGGRDNPYDHRDYECTYQDRSCDGGDVELCRFGTTDVMRTEHSSPNSSCTAKPPNEKHPNGIEGTCSYRKLPKLSHKFTGTDFSNAESLTFPKIQSESNLYNHVGSNDNPITYGSQHLSLSFEEKIIRQLLVVRRAKQTKATLHETGEWPLGWVDWGYKTPNGKTLLQINDELPDSIAAAIGNVVEGVDDFYLNAGNLEAVSNFADDQAQITQTVQEALTKNPIPTWLIDLMQAPLYSPSWRVGYVRPSICVWKICCPGFMCKVPPPIGIKRGLYFDNSISQAFGAAIDDLMLRNTLSNGIKEFKKIVIKNPLVRFATSAAPNAIPSKIKERLDKEVAAEDPCYKYRSGFSWLWFGTHMDYVQPGDFFDAERKCPDYAIMPELEKQNAAAFSLSSVQALIAMIWGQQQDDVDSVKYHVLTIPDVMGQSIQEIKQPVYDSRDTLSELEEVEEFNMSLSNTVDDQVDYLYGGKFPFDPRRMISGYYPCDSDMYSSYKETSIEAYATGEHHGCFEENKVPEGKCDGKLFGELIASSKYTTASTKGQEYFKTNIKGMLTPELMKTYATAEKATGVPCEILAGIHFVEADNNPDGSLVSGRRIGESEPDAGGKIFKSLLETAEYAGEHLLGKVGGKINSTETAITALSRYNGGGNSNCQLGYPYPIPYNGCPRLFEGEDDPYPTNFLDNKHDNMYLLYCADRTACVPQVFERPGSFTVALEVYNNITKSGYSNTDLSSPTPKPSKSPRAPQPSLKPLPIFFPKSCGPDSLSTALGCLPYTTQAAIMAILRFITGISGATSLVLMLVGVFQIMTAAGDAKKLQSGRDLFVAALSGLLFIVFSVSILRLFGTNILKLPGF